MLPEDCTSRWTWSKIALRWLRRWRSISAMRCALLSCCCLRGIATQCSIGSICDWKTYIAYWRCVPTWNYQHTYLCVHYSFGIIYTFLLYSNIQIGMNVWIYVEVNSTEVYVTQCKCTCIVSILCSAHCSITPRNNTMTCHQVQRIGVVHVHCFAILYRRSANALRRKPEKGSTKDYQSPTLYVLTYVCMHECMFFLYLYTCNVSMYVCICMAV